MDYLYYYLNSSLYGGKKTWPQNNNQNNQAFSVIFSEGHVFQTFVQFHHLCLSTKCITITNFQQPIIYKKNIYTTNENNVLHLSSLFLSSFLFLILSWQTIFPQYIIKKQQKQNFCNYFTVYIKIQMYIDELYKRFYNKENICKNKTSVNYFTVLRYLDELYKASIIKKTFSLMVKWL